MQVATTSGHACPVRIAAAYNLQGHCSPDVSILKANPHCNQ